MKTYKDGKYTHRVSVLHRDNMWWETHSMTNLFVRTSTVINNRIYVHLHHVQYDKPTERKKALQVAYEANKEKLKKEEQDAAHKH